MFRIEKIQLSQLSDFTKTDSFKSLQNIPISSLRVESYINNPNALPNDTVLYMAFDAEELVGYRTIWRETYILSEETSNSFGWLSGNWVHEKYRRKGVSTQLFNEVYKDWEGELMYTNYAVNSKLLYDKTGHFQHIKELIGTRFYARFCLGDILITKHKVFLSCKGFLVFIDAMVNFIFDVRFYFSKEKKITQTIKKNAAWGDKITSFLKDFKKGEFFKRDEDTYKWIQNFPWVKEGEKIKKESLNYYFSLYAKDYESNYYTFYNKQEEVTAVLWLSIKDGHLKIPYAYFEKQLLDEVVKFILNKCKEKRVKTMLVYHTGIAELLQQRMFYMTKKTFYQNFYATKNLKITAKDIKKKSIQSGDGDVVFT